MGGDPGALVDVAEAVQARVEARYRRAPVVAADVLPEDGAVADVARRPVGDEHIRGEQDQRASDLTMTWQRAPGGPLDDPRRWGDAARWQAQ